MVNVALNGRSLRDVSYNCALKKPLIPIFKCDAEDAGMGTLLAWGTVSALARVAGS